MKSVSHVIQNSEKWDGMFKKGAAITRFPHESLVTCYYRILKGKMDVCRGTGKVLDVGCGGAPDLSFFMSEGFRYTGIDVTSELFGSIRSRVPGFGRSYDLMLFKPPILPFKKDEFDMVIGFQSIHLNPTEKSIKAVINEIYRVMKSGGYFFFTTCHKDHLLFSNNFTRFVSRNTFEITKAFPQKERWGMRYFFFRNGGEIKKYFSMFSEVHVGKYSLDLDDGKMSAWCIIYGKK